MGSLSSEVVTSLFVPCAWVARFCMLFADILPISMQVHLPCQCNMYFCPGLLSSLVCLADLSNCQVSQGFPCLRHVV